jgi:hypothetical protein
LNALPDSEGPNVFGFPQLQSIILWTNHENGNLNSILWAQNHFYIYVPIARTQELYLVVSEVDVGISKRDLIKIEYALVN